MEETLGVAHSEGTEHKSAPLTVEFKDEEISMDINHNKVTESDGWKLEPLNPPKVITTHYTCAEYTQYTFPCIH